MRWSSASSWFQLSERINCYTTTTTITTSKAPTQICDTCERAMCPSQSPKNCFCSALIQQDLNDLKFIKIRGRSFDLSLSMEVNIFYASILFVGFGQWQGSWKTFAFGFSSFPTLCRDAQWTLCMCINLKNAVLDMSGEFAPALVDIYKQNALQPS